MQFQNDYKMFSKLHFYEAAALKVYSYQKTRQVEKKSRPMTNIKNINRFYCIFVTIYYKNTVNNTLYSIYYVLTYNLQLSLHNVT